MRPMKGHWDENNNGFREKLSLCKAFSVACLSNDSQRLQQDLLQHHCCLALLVDFLVVPAAVDFLAPAFPAREVLEVDGS